MREQKQWHQKPLALTEIDNKNSNKKMYQNKLSTRIHFDN